MVASDERRPDGRTLIPRKKGKCLAWYATVADTFAPTYLKATSVKAGSAAEILSAKNFEKYQALENRYVFCTVAAETMGPIDEGSLELLRENGRQLTKISGEPRGSQYIFQRFSIILQRGNAASFKGSFVTPYLDAI